MDRGCSSAANCARQRRSRCLDDCVQVLVIHWPTLNCTGSIKPVRVRDAFVDVRAATTGIGRSGPTESCPIADTQGLQIFLLRLVPGLLIERAA